ncbi:hypothetical protein QFZ20_002200 [Flavobacterium sp. W4I14]|nr:hypothetical protein [Flavobacterium sp. W4I14]
MGLFKRRLVVLHNHEMTISFLSPIEDPRHSTFQSPDYRTLHRNHNVVKLALSTACNNTNYSLMVYSFQEYSFLIFLKKISSFE